MIIRILAILLGILSIAVFGYMLCIESDVLTILSALSGLIMGSIFLLYGLKGNKTLAKYFPSLARSDFW